MLDNELVDMVKQIQLVRSESNKIEIKAANKGCPKVRDSLSSFSNQSGGGVIIFGVDENDGYNVCGVYDAADLMKKVEVQCQEMTPVIRPLFSVASIDGKTVVSAEIQEIDNADKPCFYSGVGRLKGSYVRSGDADRLMTEYEVYSYEAFKKSIHDELRTCERAFEKDIQTNAFKLYFDLLKSKKPNLAELSNEEICRLQGFTNEGKPTLAGIMLFSNYPQAFFPQLCITAVSVPGTEISSTASVGERFIDNQRIDGTLVQMLNDALVFVRKNMKTATIIDPNTGKRTDKTEYPVIAIRELILNALIHRDYSIHTDTTPITIKMFSDRFEIENPGGLYGRMTLDRLGKVSADTRNPKIAGAMEILGETENRYSGIPTIINAMEESGLPAPKFESDRSGDADRLMTEYEVYSYEAFKKSIHDELRTCERAFEKDIQTNAFKLYFDLLKSKKPNLAELSNEEICRLQGFTNEGKPTLAGIMLFSNYPQAFFPQLCITAVSVPGTEISSTASVGERFIDNQRIDGTLVQMLNDALVFVRKNMKTATIIDPNTGKRTDKTEYPVIAIRELILNALIHRDYSIHTDTTPITIKMFSDRFEIENPGGLYGRMTLDRLGKVSADTRNPKIAGAMEILGETENRYSGIPTIINAMEESGLPAPKFESDRGVFKVTLYNSAAESVPIDDIETEILEFCKTPRSRNEIAEFFNGRMTIAYVMERYVKPMIASSRLIMTIPEKPKSKYQKFLAR